jgi:general secretion pathway protein C
VTVTAASLLPRLVSLFLLLAVAVLAARLTWQVIEPDVRPPVTMEIRAERAAPVAADARRSPLAGIAELPLFGVPGEPVEAAPVVAPETRLRLRLLGLVTADTPDGGHAIIVENSSPERLYAVGDTIGGGAARLHQIHVDRVILERDGGYETLRLPRADGTTGGNVAAVETVRDASRAPPPAVEGPSIQRSEWLSDPERLLQTVRARPVIRDGVLYGLEVRPTRNARQFQQAGLQPGDVLTSVNGIPMSSIQDTDELFRDLSGQSRVDVVVERDGQAVPLSVQLID